MWQILQSSDAHESPVILEESQRPPWRRGKCECLPTVEEVGRGPGAGTLEDGELLGGGGGAVDGPVVMGRHL